MTFKPFQYWLITISSLCLISNHCFASSLSGEIKIKKSALNFATESNSPKNIMVILEPINQNFKAQPRTSKTHQIKMTHKEFIPGYKIIQTGDKVNFSNLESFKHNVFSSSQGNQFDLGSYTQHNQNKVKTWQQFNSSGLVKIYCNIHGQMAAFVYVSNSPFFALTDSDGKFEINQIPAGRYQLLAWNVRGEMKKQIEIIDDKNQSINLLLDYSSYIKKPHFNKNNQTYPVINENEYDSSYEDF